MCPYMLPGFAICGIPEDTGQIFILDIRSGCNYTRNYDVCACDVTLSCKILR